MNALVAELNQLAVFPGPFAPHRLFGRMSRDDAVRHQLVHAAHHLGRLVPVDNPKIIHEGHEGTRSHANA